MNGFARSGEKGSVRQGWPHPQLPRRGPVLCVVHSNCSDAAGRCPSGLSCGRSCSSHLLPPAHRLETTKKIDGRVRRGVFRNQRNHSLGRLDRVFTEYRRELEEVAIRAWPLSCIIVAFCAAPKVPSMAAPCKPGVRRKTGDNPGGHDDRLATLQSSST
jgi:hypothetical protein